MSNIKNKKTLNFIFFFSVFALSAAYYIQFILGHEPCNLCLISRIPYIFAIILISLTYLLNRYEKIILIIISLFFIFGTIISFYHHGIEQGFFSETLICSIGDKKQILSSNDLLKQLENKTVSCKNTTFTFFGFSLATLNTITSLFISGIIIKSLANYEKNK